MLKKFRVSNFRSFEKDFEFDLSGINGYEFNKESIKNGIVNNALIYGHNGVGKSNLGLALFDLIGHLTEKNISDSSYVPYLNATSQHDLARFHYEFSFGANTVIYDYEKSDVRTTQSESLEINGKLLAKIDRKVSNQATIKFKGAETLNSELTNKNLSLIKYIKSNTQLADNRENAIFFTFYDFLESMLFFRSLDQNMYLGLETGSGGIQEDIIKRGNVKDLENFLNRGGIQCKLTVAKELDRDVLAFDFDGKPISFYQIASTGTKSLTLFYFWLQRLKEKSKVKFLFIDEFDAFYHHELSALIVEELKKTNIQFILTSHNTSIITNDLLRP
ncbi:MAG: ATP-binding protein, partial [Crocinitomix sp.]|nr:ATP-binding protein [Crocinitomix sp.]